MYAATRKEVAEKLRNTMAAKDDTLAIEATDITFAEFLTCYEDVAKETMKQRSFETYRDIARAHLLRAFGKLKLKNLTREHVQCLFFAVLIQPGRFALLSEEPPETS